MTDDREALERLERRVAQLEAVVRQLASGARPTLPPPPPTPARPPVSSPLPAPHAPLAPSPQALAPKPPSPDWEQWVGQRGLLAVGILALLVAGALLLKHAFERGWIPPWLRVNAGVLAGAGVAYLGDRLIRRGLRRYGAALVGAGGGLAYLAIWAAAGPYGLIAHPLGLVLLLGVSAGVAARAATHRIEALVVWALVGAFFGPVFLPETRPSAEVLLAYFAIVGFTSGYLAVRLGWRLAFGVALAGYFVLPAALMPAAAPWYPWLGFLAFGGAAALAATAGRAWLESRLGAVAWPWLVLWTLLVTSAPARAPGDAGRWALVGAAAVLMVAAWWQHRATSPFRRQPGASDPGEVVVFLVAAPALVAVAARAGPEALHGAGGVVPAAAAGLYLASGWPRRADHLVAMGFGLLALAVAGQWDGIPVAVGWTVLAVSAAAAARWVDQSVGSGVAAALAVLAFLQLFGVALLERPDSDPALTGGWSFAWYALMAGAAACARWARFSRPATVAWIVAGAALWLGGSLELYRLFDLRGAALAGDLAISAFWVVYAGALVRLGFALGRKPVRVAGLLLAGVAAAKIVLYDLANLQALYRVGSFFVLALITLAVAYLYHRRSRNDREQADSRRIGA